jgi:hypothetical protein
MVGSFVSSSVGLPGGRLVLGEAARIGFGDNFGFQVLGSIKHASMATLDIFVFGFGL